MEALPLIHLDTHIVAWLYEGASHKIPNTLLNTLEQSALEVSPMVWLELQYLFDLKRVNEPARVVIEFLGRKLGLRVSQLPFHHVVSTATEIGWTRDPFDRLIVAQALAAGAALATADKTIHKHCASALWR